MLLLQQCRADSLLVQAVKVTADGLRIPLRDGPPLRAAFDLGNFLLHLQGCSLFLYISVCSGKITRT